ncbi:glutathione S-transferase [Komagataeibacter saccharivorans]|uniref:glutathione S-transferase family protein n=1 Tax=Komagataeibacter saccharivorans TaxID=265959 RepID=UPI000D7CAD93|nr:glutathione S-transferase family protein [Komagataeibacter saccharivorans]PYD52196.1 glutathione S-transferase [Komagataeibacter saccharivorans]GBQ36367.1 glutathione S-transferase [Komagataeibacter saccharivorans NRIC 0614]
MSYRLYYSPGTASMAVHWMLIEIGAPFETVLVDLTSGGQQTAAYRRLNPAGRVPTLVVDGIAHGESAALLMLLAERHPEAALMPAPDSADRATWLEIMIQLANTLLPAMRDWFYADTDGEPIGADAVRSLARRRIETAWDHLDRRLSSSQSHLVSDRFSTADFLAIMLMRWARNMPRPATTWPNLSAYIERVTQRPSFIEVNRREGLANWPMSLDLPEQDGR